MRSTRLLVTFLVLVGLFCSINLGASTGFAHSYYYIDPVSPDLSDACVVSASESVTVSSPVSSPDQESVASQFSKVCDLALTQFDRQNTSENISIVGVNPPTASFFKVRTQLYPDFFVRESRYFGEDNAFKFSPGRFQIQPEWYLLVSSQSSKRISGWKQSNLTANSKIYPHIFHI